MLRLHVSRGSVALAPHIALEEAGADYALTWLDFAQGDQTRPDYLAINPKGRVPALETPHGILTEASAILTYIADTHPDAGLMPQDIFLRARVQELHLTLAATVHVNHAHKKRGARWADDAKAQKAMTAKVAQNMTENAALLEEHFLTGPWERHSRPPTSTFSRWVAGSKATVSTCPPSRH